MTLSYMCVIIIIPGKFRVVNMGIRMGGEEFCPLNLWKSMISIFIDPFTNENLLYADILRVHTTTLANIISCNCKIILDILGLAQKSHLYLLVAAGKL